MEFKSVRTPRELITDKESLSAVYGRFTAEPFDRGYGTTIGNSLRRIMLSSVQGAAITSMRIEGKTHEFDTIEGMREDLLDVILNLKSLQIKLHGNKGETTISLNVEGPKTVTAADFQLNDSIEILNPDQTIAHLSKDGVLNMECTVQTGRGYMPAAQVKEQSGLSDSFGVIFLDAAFSPIVNVKYTVEAARAGQRTDFDRLVLEVMTDGSIGPEEAVSYSAKVLSDQMRIFISMRDQAEELAAEEERQLAADATQALQDKLDKSIEELELSVRSFNCLEAAGIKTIRDLVQKTESEMLKYRNFGRKSLNEIKNILKEMGLRFGLTIDPNTQLPESL
ncbi:MAG: DNA-directed RNA polymerase subunit alpha [Bacteroidetes bacterium HGW-Bacteroidetes-14]|jgi:DNA-directed RNA polymerase subunit alpha|nr:MAG: DNA-directed RNA polymerase subunit alpha [candidate division BRC1 bacterium HGW-BRC1-1]PKP38362.1 MAG: DNA-directed RNA polymerase subunit alpha [Bacteroidetes bacterium HGW-Bacteroidetes-14]